MSKKTKPAKPPKLGPGRLSADEAAKLPDRLLSAALHQFAANGYANTTMEQIARAAGASTKTIYSRHPNKAAILTAGVQRVVENVLAAHAAAQRTDPRAVTPREFLVSLGGQIARALGSGEGATLIYLALSEARRFPELAALYNAVIGEGTGRFRAALEGWKAAGLLPDLEDPAAAARLCVSMLTDAARVRSALGQPMTPAEIDAHVGLAAEIFLRGCGYRARHA